jgi:hypothetical protein
MSDDVSADLEVKRPLGIELRRDGRGLALFTGGAFFSVLLGLALSSAEPLESISGTGVLARAWAASVGLLPGLLFCGGIAVLGAREFLRGDRKDLKRHVRGLALTALGLSILVGAFSDTAGGFLGHHSSGAVARGVHVLPAAIIGLAAFVLPIWTVWLKRGILEGAPAAEVETEPTAIVFPAPRPAPDADLGVSPAEAAALIPEDLPSWRARPRKFVAADLRPPPPSPYREDVRLRGQIPEGAKPFHPLHASSPTPTPHVDEPRVPAVHERVAEPEPRRAAVSARPDLALPPERSESDPVLEMPASIGRRPRAEELEELRLALEELTLDETEVAMPLEPEPAPAGEIDRPDASAITPPTPSWEQPDLFGEGEEPVDAYGTPISVVEAVRVAEAPVEEAAAEPEVEPEVESGAESEEPEVTLKPVAARPRKKPAPAEPAALPSDDHARLIAEIGIHLLERGRVAVSMLQKQYGMDFEAATSVLDELQRMGLIGPYLGGQRRDILLTREEWLEKVSSL